MEHENVKPRKKKDRALTERLTVRISPQVDELLAGESEKRKVTKNALVRELIEQGVSSPNTRNEVASVVHVPEFSNVAKELNRIGVNINQIARAQAQGRPVVVTSDAGVEQRVSVEYLGAELARLREEIGRVFSKLDELEQAKVGEHENVSDEH
jgi:hypothetical protein